MFINSFLFFYRMKKGIVIILGMLFLVGFVSAANESTSKIKVKTHPYHEVQISVFDPDASSYTQWEKYIGTSNQYGDVYWNFSSDEEEFGLQIFIKTLEHESVISKKYSDNYEIGEDVYIELAKNDFVFIPTPQLNVSESEIEEEVETNSSETNSTTLNSTEETTEIESENIPQATVPAFMKDRTTYIILGVVLLIIIIIFLVKKHKKKISGGLKEIKIKKLSELVNEREEESRTNKELQEAEENLRKAQIQINALKNKEKIDQIEEEIEKKKKELSELRGDEVDDDSKTQKKKIEKLKKQIEDKRDETEEIEKRVLESKKKRKGE